MTSTQRSPLSKKSPSLPTAANFPSPDLSWARPLLTPNSPRSATQDGSWRAKSSEKAVFLPLQASAGVDTSAMATAKPVKKLSRIILSLIDPSRRPRRINKILHRWQCSPEAHRELLASGRVGETALCAIIPASEESCEHHRQAGFWAKSRGDGF